MKKKKRIISLNLSREAKFILEEIGLIDYNCRSTKKRSVSAFICSILVHSLGKNKKNSLLLEQAEQVEQLNADVIKKRVIDRRIEERKKTIKEIKKQTGTYGWEE